MVMGEVQTNINSTKDVCDVNTHFGWYGDTVDLSGKIWLRQRMIFHPEPKSTLTIFSENVGETISWPRIKKWLKWVGNKKPEV
jgi:hypothetical protein